EPVCVVDSQRTEWRHDGRADAEAPIQAGRIDSRRVVPHAARVAEERDRDIVVETDRVLAGHGHERVAETLLSGNRGAPIEIPERGDRPILVPSQRLPALGTPHQETFEGEPGSVPEHRPGPGAEAEG